MSTTTAQESTLTLPSNMAENINWTPIIQKMTQNQQGNYFLDFLYSPLNDAEMIDFFTLASKFKVDVDNPCKADLINLNAANRSVADCAACDKTKSGACYKIGVAVIDGRIKTVKSLCKDEFAEKIIRNSDEPLKFRAVLSRDWKVTSANKQAAVFAAKSIREGNGLFICGAAGTGKTMLSCIIINERALMGKTALFYTVTDMLEDLKDFSNNLLRLEKMKKLQSCPCLVIDDLGAEYTSDWVSSTLFSILDARYKKDLMTVINSNFSLDKLASRYSDYHGERIVRRIKELCAVCSIG